MLQKVSVLLVAHNLLCVAAAPASSHCWHYACVSEIGKSLCAFLHTVPWLFHKRIGQDLMVNNVLYSASHPHRLAVTHRFQAHMDETWALPEPFHFKIWYKLTTHLIPPLTVDFDNDITKRLPSSQALMKKGEGESKKMWPSVSLLVFIVCDTGMSDVSINTLWLCINFTPDRYWCRCKEYLMIYSLTKVDYIMNPCGIWTLAAALLEYKYIPHHCTLLLNDILRKASTVRSITYPSDDLTNHAVPVAAGVHGTVAVVLHQVQFVLES